MKEMYRFYYEKMYSNVNPIPNGFSKSDYRIYNSVKGEYAKYRDIFVERYDTQPYVSNDFVLHQHCIKNKLFVTEETLKENEKFIYMIRPYGGLSDCIHKIDVLQSISDVVMKSLQNKRAILLISYMEEGMIQNFEIERWEKALKKHNIDNIFFTISNLNMKERYVGKINFIQTNMPLETNKWWYESIRNNKFGTIPSIMKEEDLNDSIRDYYYITYNKNPKFHRKELISFLRKENLLDKGLVSYIRPPDGENPIFMDGDPVIDTEEKEDNYLLGHGYDMSSQYARSYFTISTETAFDNNNVYVTEKTWKPIVQLQPFVMLASYHHLKRVQELGFKTFHPHIDESFDEEKDNIKRLNMVLTEIKKLCSMSKEEIHKWYFSLKDTLIHNQKHFFDCKIDNLGLIEKCLEN